MGLRFLAAVGTVAGLASASCGPSSPPVASSPERAPVMARAVSAKEDFSLESLTTPGKAAIERGSVTLLIFWATWHHPSKVAFPRLAELQKKYAARGFTVVALSVDEDETGRGALVAEAAREWGANFPVAWDKGHAVALAWRPATMPTIYLLDRKRAVVHEHNGWHDGDEEVIAREIEAML